MILAFSKDSPAEARGNGGAGRGDFGNEHMTSVGSRCMDGLLSEGLLFPYRLDIFFISTAFK